MERSADVSAVGRRQVLLGAAAALAARSLPAAAIVDGDQPDLVDLQETGAVGVYIDLTDCKVCKKGIPGTCSGTLIAPDLVLSAKHCLDVPQELGGKLDRVVFGPSLTDEKAETRKVIKTATTAEYGYKVDGNNDLLLLKLDRPAPPSWKPVTL